MAKKKIFLQLFHMFHHFSICKRCLYAFSLDKRSLVVGRVFVSLIIIIDLLNRTRWLSAHYTDDGLLPRYLATEQFFFPTWFSFHLITGT